MRGPVVPVHPIALLFLLFLTVTVALASVYGGGPERWTAGFLATAWLATKLVERTGLHRFSQVNPAVAVIDAALLVAIVLVALKADRTWPVLLAALQTLTTLGHLGRAVNPSLWIMGYAMMVTLPAWPGLLVLLIGVANHRRRLRRLGADRSWRIS